MTLEVFVCPKCGIVQTQVGVAALANRFVCTYCKTEIPTQMADTYSLAEEGDLPPQR